MLSCQHEEELQCNHTYGICSGYLLLPRTASTVRSHKHEIVCFGRGKKGERQDSLITILCSSYCQVTYHTVVKHVRLAKSCHVLSFGGNREWDTSAKWLSRCGIQKCVNFAWTILKTKQTKFTQTLPSPCLQSLVIILLQIFIWDTWFSLSVLKRQLWAFSHLQSQRWESKSETTALGHVSCHRHPVPNPSFTPRILTWIWGGNTSLGYNTCIGSHKSMKGSRSPSCDHSCGHAPCILLSLNK